MGFKAGTRGALRKVQEQVGPLPLGVLTPRLPLLCPPACYAALCSLGCRGKRPSIPPEFTELLGQSRGQAHLSIQDCTALLQLPEYISALIWEVSCKCLCTRGGGPRAWGVGRAQGGRRVTISQPRTGRAAAGEKPCRPL